MTMHNQTLALDFRALQKAQHLHDGLAHRDILELSAQRRLTHFTLHFAKYAGTLLVARRTGNRPLMGRMITDSLIIALAFANSLGIELQRSLADEGEHPICREGGEDSATLLLRYVEIVGEMGKACEAFDHASERYPSFDVLERAITKLTRLVLACAVSEGVDLGAAVADRWMSVEAKFRQIAVSAAA